MYLSIRKENQLVKHVEDLKSRLMDGENNRAIAVRQFVQMVQKLNGRCGIKACLLHSHSQHWDDYY